MNILKNKGYEEIAGFIIAICLTIIILTILGIHSIDVKVINIELIDHGLYTIVTETGAVNITSNDILRIEKTLKKTSLEKLIEIYKIYTEKGFIYFSSLDPYVKSGLQLINTVDNNGSPSWARSNYSDYRSLNPYRYAIGTPEESIPYITILLALQNFSLIIGGITLFFLIFPIRWKESKSQQKGFPSNDSEYKNEEQIGALAK